jgi:hypothetical protein
VKTGGLERAAAYNCRLREFESDVGTALRARRLPSGDSAPEDDPAAAASEAAAMRSLDRGDVLASLLRRSQRKLAACSGRA